MNKTPTELLYLNDPLLEEFDARVAAHGSLQGKPALILDRTAFYPESGGQPADHGTINDLQVNDVQKDDQGNLLHLLEGALPALGESIQGRIDMPRRRLHMAQHTGQHMLSMAMQKLFDARTVSSHLGESICTLDLKIPELSPEQLGQAEVLVNRKIDEDLPVRTRVPSTEELAGLELRRRPKVDHDVRVVEVGDFDRVACGGTHCTRSSQVGLLLILSAERYKSMTRVSFEAGQKARRLTREHLDLLSSVSRRLGTSLERTPEKTEVLQGQLEKARQEVKTSRSLLARLLAADLAKQAAGGRVVAQLEAGDAELLRLTAKQLIKQGIGEVLLAAVDGDQRQVLAVRGSQSDFDCGAFLRTLTREAGGTGGGRPEHAEGRIRPGNDWSDLVAKFF